MTRRLTAELGLTPRCAVLTALALTAFVLAVALTVPSLYGAAFVLAFAAGGTWDRRLACDDCHRDLDER